MSKSLFPERIETDRLRLERLSRETVDVHEFYRVCSADPGIEDVTKYVTWGPHETPKETVDFLDRAESRWEDDEAAEYVVRPRESEPGAGEIAGCTGLEVDWSRRRAALGLWLRKRFWGRGYSGERAAALLEVAFTDLDLEVVTVSHHVENDKSRRAIEKYVERFGGRREGTLRNQFVAGEEVGDEVRYSISREEYEAATA